MPTSRYLLLITSCFLFLFSYNDLNAGQLPSSSTPPGKICVAFYNVENLFDTVDDPGIDDAEFLPDGKNHWTTDKYHTKIANIAKVIKAMNDGNGPDILGLAEVENMHVMKDLAADPQL